MTACRSCGRPITWHLTARGRYQPLDADGRPHQATCPARRRPSCPADRCSTCGSTAVEVLPGVGQHHAGLRCRDCGQHRWLAAPHGDAA